MKKKIKNLISFIFIFFPNFSFSDNIENQIEPEIESQNLDIKNKVLIAKENIIVTANDYATQIGHQILNLGGNVVDSAVAIQLTLGLVEPQSSGLGGGMFITYYDYNSKQTYFYDGREKAPKNIQNNIFLDKDKNPKKFYDAAIGGKSVGVPGTLDTLYKIHSEYGNLEWAELIEPVIKLSKNGFYPPPRLISSLEKEKYLFRMDPNSIYLKILEKPENKFINNQYTSTLKLISENYRSFYDGKIAKDIVKKVNQNKDNNKLSISDLENFYSKKKKAFCSKLQKITICGPALPSSGTISITQILKLIDYLHKQKKLDINNILKVLNFTYFLRDKHLADDNFIKIDIKKILDDKFLIEEFSIFENYKKYIFVDEVLSSTSHYSIVDKSGNAISVTSSIESSFGSRLFTNGFFLNNQLTDFSFKQKDNAGNFYKNRVEGGKKPLSSMSPLIIFDTKGNFLMTIGSPGGKAIISYISRILIDYFYFEKKIKESIEDSNYLRIYGKTFVEDEKLKASINGEVQVRSLTSGIGIIIKKSEGLIGYADHRRDGTVRGN